MKFRKLVVGVWVLAALGAFALQVRAGSDKIVFPEGFEKGVLYATRDRHDVKRFHEIYSSKTVVDAVRKGQRIPNGTVLTMVQYLAKVDDKGVPVKGSD